MSCNSDFVSIVTFISLRSELWDIDSVFLNSMVEINIFRRLLHEYYTVNSFTVFKLDVSSPSFSFTFMIDSTIFTLSVFIRLFPGIRSCGFAPDLWLSVYLNCYHAEYVRLQGLHPKESILWRLKAIRNNMSLLQHKYIINLCCFCSTTTPTSERPEHHRGVFS